MGTVCRTPSFAPAKSFGFIIKTALEDWKQNELEDNG